MKGQSTLSDMMWTLFMVIVVSFIVLVSLTFVSFTKVKQVVNGEQGLIVYSIEFVTIAVKPFYAGEALSFYPMEDRLFFEHALESVIVNSVENSSSIGIVSGLEDFAEPYDFDSYYFSISRDNNVLLEVDNLPRTCGEDANGDERLDGICINALRSQPSDVSLYGKCGVGRIEIDDSGQCRFYQSCCKEDKAEYSRLNPDIQIVSCARDAGICSRDPRRSNILPLGSLSCDEGRVKFSSDTECDNANAVGIGQAKIVGTPICCVPAAPESLMSAGITSTAEIPLFFSKTPGGSIEVNIR